MGVKKFIHNVIESLSLSEFKLKGKRKSLKTLLQKLKKRRVKILKAMRDDIECEREQELSQELEIVSFHIAKAKKKLASLA
jgi:gamma-glutamyl phosphate reductase